MNTKITAISVSIVVVVLAACGGSAETIRTKIDQVGIGADHSAVIAIMGRPVATNMTNTLGIETSTLVWRVDTTACEVTLTFNRVVTKSCRSLSL